MSASANEVMNCRKCDLWKICQAHPVPIKNYSKRTTKGGIMVIVYSPGLDAEFLGEPIDTLEFSILSSLGLKDFYATCVVKCPSKNPKIKEVSTCVEYIIEEIQQIQPSSIFVFGEKAGLAMRRFGVLDSITNNGIKTAVYNFPSISRIFNSGNSFFANTKEQIQDILNA